MVKHHFKVFCVIFIFLYPKQIIASSDDITVKELILGDQKDFHLKILKAIPENGQISIGPKNAKNTIIEFFDYKCGFCVKMHPELVDIAKIRKDTRVIFLQLPILSETSVKLAKLVLAAKYQDKGFEIHHALLTQKGSLTDKKINKIIEDVKIDSKKIKEDLKRQEIDEALKITSFIGNAIGARGTPAVFINNQFNPGYVPKSIIENFLDK